MNVPITISVDLSEVFTRFDRLDSNLTKGIETIMATIEDVQADLDTIKQEAGDYIAQRDAIDVTLNATIADLTRQLAAGTATAAAVQTGIDAAFATAESAKAQLAPPSGVAVPT